MDTKYLDVIKAPVVTEKSANMGQNGEYVFMLILKQIRLKLNLLLKKYLV